MYERILQAKAKFKNRKLSCLFVHWRLDNRKNYDLVENILDSNKLRFNSNFY